MSELENEYKKRFNNQEMSDDQFDVEGLWDSIHSELHQPPTPKNGFQSHPFFMGLLFLVSIGGLLTFWYLNQSNTINPKILSTSTSIEHNEISNQPSNHIDNVNENNLKNSPIKEQKTSIENESSNEFSNNHSNESKIKLEKDNLESIISNDENSFLNTLKSNSNNIANGQNNFNVNNKNKRVNNLSGNFNVNQQQQLLNDDGKKNNIENKVVENTSKFTPVTHEDNETSKIIGDLDNKFNDNKSESNINKTSSVTFDLKNIPYLNPTFFTVHFDKKAKSVSPKSSIKPISNWNKYLNVHTGINSLVMNFSSTDTELASFKNDKENGYWGSSYGIEGGFIYKNRWTIQTGVAYHDLWTKLDLVTKTEKQIQKDSILVGVLIDKNTGKVISETYKDSLISQTITHTIIHYNQFKTISIPLEIGIQKNTKRWILGLNTGVIFNFTTFQFGKAIDSELTVQSFTKNDSIAPFKSFALGLTFSPFLGYKVYKNLTLIVQPKWSWYQGSALKTGFNSSIHQLNFDVGFRMDF